MGGQGILSTDDGGGATCPQVWGPISRGAGAAPSLHPGFCPSSPFPEYCVDTFHLIPSSAAFFSLSPKCFNNCPNLWLVFIHFEKKDISVAF